MKVSIALPVSHALREHAGLVPQAVELAALGADDDELALAAHVRDDGARVLDPGALRRRDGARLPRGGRAELEGRHERDRGVGRGAREDGREHGETRGDRDQTAHTTTGRPMPGAHENIPLMQCDECGYDYNELARDEVASRIRSFRGRYAMALAAHTDEELRTRPEPNVWSPLEYACHIRDVFRTQTARIALTLEEDTPEYASMRRDERVLEERYNEQDPQARAP